MQLAALPQQCICSRQYPNMSLSPRDHTAQGKVHRLISEELCIWNSSPDGKQDSKRQQPQGKWKDGMQGQRNVKVQRLSGTKATDNMSSHKAWWHATYIKSTTQLSKYYHNANKKKSRNKIRDVQWFHQVYEIRLCLFRISRFVGFFKESFYYWYLYKHVDLCLVCVWILVVPVALKLQVKLWVVGLELRSSGKAVLSLNS